MSTPLEPGAETGSSVIVAAGHFASNITEAAPDVFSTMALGALVEQIAADWLAEHIREDEISVGAQLVINHAAPTPEGLTVTATVRLREADHPRYEFDWTASDGVDEVGNGTHQRFVVERVRFMRRVARKQQEQT